MRPGNEGNTNKDNQGLADYLNQLVHNYFVCQ